MSKKTKTKTPRQTEKKKAGRPPGPYEPPPEAIGELTRCPKCGSTERDRYTQKTEIPFNHTLPNGKPYTHVVLRRTRCATPNCRQVRIDRTYEYRAANVTDQT